MVIVVEKYSAPALAPVITVLANAFVLSNRVKSFVDSCEEKAQGSDFYDSTIPQASHPAAYPTLPYRLARFKSIVGTHHTQSFHDSSQIILCRPVFCQRATTGLQGKIALRYMLVFLSRI
jgi:hypothetical protein